MNLNKFQEIMKDTGELHRSLARCSPRGHKESDMTLNNNKCEIKGGQSQLEYWIHGQVDCCKTGLGVNKMQKERMICLEPLGTFQERWMSPLVKPQRNQEFDVLEVRGRDSEAALGEKWLARRRLGVQGSCTQTGGDARREKCGLGNMVVVRTGSRAVNIPWSRKQEGSLRCSVPDSGQDSAALQGLELHPSHLAKSKWWHFSNHTGVRCLMTPEN